MRAGNTKTKKNQRMRPYLVSVIKLAILVLCGLNNTSIILKALNNVMYTPNSLQGMTSNRVHDFITEAYAAYSLLGCFIL